MLVEVLGGWTPSALEAHLRRCAVSRVVPDLRMRLGIGLPSTIPGVSGSDIVTWAQRAESAGFSSLAVLDRLVYPNVEPLIALAAAAAVTDRIELATTILIGPYRGNAALLAKQLASIDLLSNARLTVGIAAGTRDDDYRVSDVDFADRGRLLDRMIDTFDLAWGAPSECVVSRIGPKPVHGRPQLLFGGTARAALRRAATRGDGWVMGGGDAAAFEKGAAALATAWADAGRQDQPRTAALAYFALGDTAHERVRGYLTEYYAFLGEQTAAAIAAGAVTDPATARARARDFAAAGCGELMFIPCDAGAEQVTMLAQALQLPSPGADRL